MMCHSSQISAPNDGSVVLLSDTSKPTKTKSLDD